LRLDAVFSAYQPDAVVHFAGFAYVGESVSRPDIYYLTNVSGSLTLFEAMRRHNVRNVLFSSSCATYGIPNRLPIIESHAQNPINPYGASKLMVERILDDYRLAFGFRPIILRYFNAAGADPEGEIGEVHDPEPHVIPLAIQAAAGLRKSFNILGADYDTPDGTCIRDFIHVHDLARAHCMAIDRLIAGGDPMVVNLGTGNGHSVREVAEMANLVVGRKADIVLSARRPGDPPILVADPSLAREKLGWSAEIGDLQTIVDHAWNWMKKHNAISS
jgi:UDP-glucose-4-epimerase GalE